MDITLINYMKEQLELVSLAFKRYNYDKLPWEARLALLVVFQKRFTISILLSPFAKNEDHQKLMVKGEKVNFASFIHHHSFLSSTQHF